MNPPSSKIVTHEEVMFFDTDCGGVVHNLAYLRMIETARTKLAEQLGMNMAEMAKEQRFPVLLRTEVDYKQPARLSDKLRIEGGVESVKGVRFWCQFELYRESGENEEAKDELLVAARQQLAVISLEEGKGGRPERLPESITGLELV